MNIEECGRCRQARHLGSWDPRYHLGQRCSGPVSRGRTVRYTASNCSVGGSEAFVDSDELLFKKSMSGNLQELLGLAVISGNDRFQC